MIQSWAGINCSKYGNICRS